MKKYIPQALFSLLLSTSASAAPIDLSSWTELTLDFPGSQQSGNWVLESGNEAVKQTVNADPSMYLNNINQTSYSMSGSWQVTTGSDDDYMGFVFGYQNSSNFYLFDWKQNSQGYAGTYAREGMTIKKMTGATGDGLTDLSISEFWENEHDFGDMEVLAKNHGSSEGWIDGRLYNFNLDFNLNPGEIAINVVDTVTSSTLWDITLYDSTFTSGQFGFYNNSQSQVRYAGFTQQGGTTVSEPGSLALLALGIAGIGFTRRRQK